MVFRRNPELGDDVPEEIVKHWEDIDKRGNHGDVFLKNVFHDGMEAGHAGILVDYPKVENPDAQTLRDEREKDLRPYWVHIHKEDIRNFRTIQVNGETVLQQISIRQSTYEPDGDFGEEEVVRYRVYSRVNIAATGEDEKMGVRWEVWEEDDSDEPQPTSEKGVLANVDAIPFVVIYGRPTGFLTSVPPLLDLAWLNVLHYQTNSDYYHACHIGCVPMLAVMGADSDGEVEIGPNSTLNLPEGAKAEWVETSGTALEQARKTLKDLEGQEAVMGLSLLQGEKRAAETAEAKRMDKSEKDSALTTAARSLEDGIEQALKFHAQHMGLDKGGTASVNRDFEQQQLSPEEIGVLSQMVQAGNLSQETLWQMLQEGEVLPDEFDAEVERTRLEGAGMVPPRPEPDE